MKILKILVSLYLFMIVSVFVYSYHQEWPEIGEPVFVSNYSNPPHFVVPIKIYRGEDLVGFANATFVNKEYGLFVTNAHVVNFGDGFEIRLGGNWYPVYKSEDLINWSADLALVRYQNQGDIKINEANLYLGQVKTGSVARIKGHLWIKEESAMQTKNVAVDCLIEKISSHFGFTYASNVQELETRFLGRESKVPDKELYKLYEQYLVIKDGNITGKLQEGLSGSPLVTTLNHVVGINSSGNDYFSLVVPAREIVYLVRKVDPGFYKNWR